MRPGPRAPASTGPEPELGLAAIKALEPTDAFLAACEAYGLAFEGQDLPRLGRYLAMLIATNEKFNLTAIDEPAQGWTRHIFDSLTLVPLIGELEPRDKAEGVRVADVGSGGGLPGLPLAICMPSARFTLIEPTGKKARFLGAVAAELGLRNVRVVSDRAEVLGQQRGAHRESYDVAMARAVGGLAMLVELLAPLARVGGRVLAIKGAKACEELTLAERAIQLMGAAHVGTVQTPTGQVVVLEKMQRTPRDYPRRDGEPKRTPLIGPGLGTDVAPGPDQEPDDEP
jgi:16S rRNA (guanine527-N7)-methyltransferase